MKKLLVTAALAAIATAAPASAASFLITPGATQAVASNNDFQDVLASAAHGNRDSQSLGATIEIVGGGIITFEFLGSESGNVNTFHFAGLPNYSEVDGNHFGAPLDMGSVFAAAGDFLGYFTSVGGTPAGPGDTGFTVFLPNDGSLSSNVLYFGYDDTLQFDDNHDDFIIRATISPVPEPATWAMMVGGIAAVGFAMRRRPRTARVSFS